MSKKIVKNSAKTNIEIPSSRVPKKKTANTDPFARIHLHPLEELEARNEELEFIIAPGPTIPSPTIPTGTVDQNSSLDSPTIPSPTITITSSELINEERNSYNNITHNNSSDDFSSFQTVSADFLTSPTIPSPTIPTAPVPSTPTPYMPVAPMRDFQKVSNSIAREAIPNGIFKSGKSKQLYDALYALTRGAIRPQRVIRITKPKLMKMAGIGTRQTLWLNLEHLNNVGLVKTLVLLGEHGGNEYEIFTPEEIGFDFEVDSSPAIPTIPTRMVQQEQNLHLLHHPETIPSTPSLIVENRTSYNNAKTLYKTNTYDDEFTQTLNEFCLEITGRALTQNDLQGLKEIAKILGTEMLRARSKTKNISSFVPFLAAHLKSRLSDNHKKGSEPKIDKIGKSTGQINLENELQILSDLKDLEGIEAVEKWKDNYSKEDWKYFMKNLES